MTKARFEAKLGSWRRQSRQRKVGIFGAKQMMLQHSARATLAIFRATRIGVSLDGRVYSSLAPIAARAGAPPSAIAVDPHRPEQVMFAHLFQNMLAHYRKTPLGRELSKGPREKSLFLDVGANLGIYAFIARESGFKTVCIEPDPDCYNFLSRNSHMFGPSIGVAASDRLSYVPFHANPGKAGANSLEPTTGPVKCMVESDTIAHILDCASIAASEIAVVKIDVEGSEAKALAGLVPVLVAGARPALWCEVRGDTGRRGSGSYRKVCALLQTFGYRTAIPVDADTNPRVMDFRFSTDQVFGIKSG